jgi:GH15 family glucan-1,4-alpha-glucosidase
VIQGRRRRNGEEGVTPRIEDYALIGDCHTGALVSRQGSIDWLCLPRFDSGACFAALLGSPENGRWRIAPCGAVRRICRYYLENTLVLETEFETDSGRAALIDLMPPQTRGSDLVRIVEGRAGEVGMHMDLAVRFDYGSIVPWVRHADDGIRATAGPDTILLSAGAETRGRGLRTESDFTVRAGQRVSFVLSWHPSHEAAPEPPDPLQCFEDTVRWWRDWSGRCRYRGAWRDAVIRSLITLKALTYAPTGGILAAATTSLPEAIGSVRNWDYRYCWLRDATFALYALMSGGYVDEARAWREWLVRAVAGKPSETQIMYGIAGERRLTELELGWLGGYEGSRPVRIGNAAADQHQLDVYGEVMDALHFARGAGLEPSENAWRIQCAIMSFLESDWERPDDGIWEVRGPRRNFTHSKVMAWVAADRAVKAVERHGLAGDVDRWRALRDRIKSDVLQHGFDAERNSFVQYYGAKDVDASLLMIPLVGFLPASDPRMLGTVEAVRRDLLREGYVHRYPTRPEVDGLPPGEGTFLACTFWLADNLALQGKHEEAQEIFDRLLEIRNDVGLLAEQYDVGRRRLVGNFPQAFSHVGLINTAQNLSRPRGPAEKRGAEEEAHTASAR